MLRLLSFFLALSLTSVSFAQTWNLSWSDEFNGTSIDPNKWGYDIGTGAAQGLWGWGNGELQYYTDDTDNARVENGELIITAIEEEFAGSSYTSSRMVTKNKFSQTHGKWEARIDLPTGQGIWPAFWMLRENNPWPGEIDIMELVGNAPGSCHGTAHWGAVDNVQSLGGSIYSDDWTTGYHTYTVEWWPDHIQWSVDGQVYFNLDRTQVSPTPWLFAEDYHMLLNVAVGGMWPGSPDGTTQFPQVMKVDWVRVYEHVPEPQPVTFRVNMSNQALGPDDEVYVSGLFDGWAGSATALSEEGNGIWSTTLDLPQGLHEYRFTINGWGGVEEVFSSGAPGTITVEDGGNTFVNRYVDVGWSSVVTDADCFSNPDACPGLGGPGCNDPNAGNYNSSASSNDGSCLYAVTFSVGLNGVSADGQTAYVNGTFNDWCGECAPMSDVNGDGIWSTILLLPSGGHQFKYTTEGWSGLVETFPVGAPCTSTSYDGPNVYTNRTFVLGNSPMVLETACFGTCDICEPEEPVMVSVTLRVQMPDPSMSALVEVDGVVHAMDPALWGAWQTTVSVQAYAPIEFRFGTPAGGLGPAWESIPGCGGAHRQMTWIEETAMPVVCFGECAACMGCADPFASNFSPLANPDSPSSLCTGLAESGCAYSDAVNYNALAIWDDGSCMFTLSGYSCPDLDGDGFVGVSDVLAMLSQFGSNCN